jgi:PPOX class probable F420-dependent enzyme
MPGGGPLHVARSEFLKPESDFIATQRVLRFNSLTPSGGIHSVPVCFAFDGRGFFIHAKMSGTKRLRNIEENPVVSVELDSYSDNWSRLKGVLVYGKAELLESGSDHEIGLRLLRKKYPQYRKAPRELTPDVPVVKITPSRVTSWYLGGDNSPRSRYK